VPVSPLLAEMLLEALRIPRPYPLGGKEERFFAVLLDQIRFERVLPFHLIAPSSAPLRALVAQLDVDPANRRTLAEWASVLRSSERTLARSFKTETGLTFGEWRTQFRLLRAVEGLAQGSDVTSVGFAVGYEGTSAFISAFKRRLGMTPGRYAL
jgi:AraC-like DNA-binding protein